MANLLHCPRDDHAAVTPKMICCGHETPMVFSRAVWSSKTGHNILNYGIFVLEIQVCLIVALTWILHFLLKPLRQPKLVSQIIAGILLGPSVLGRNKKLSAKLFPCVAIPALELFAVMGYMLFLFLMGVKMDLSMVRKSGRKAMSIGLLSLFIPLMLTISSSMILGKTIGNHARTFTTMLNYMGAAQSLSAFPVIACFLNDLEILNSELGRLALSSAAVSDLFSLFLIVGTTSNRIGHYSLVQTLANFIACTIFMIIMAYIFRPAIRWVIRNSPEGKPVKEFYINFIILAVFMSGCMTALIGQQAFLGPFVLGLIIPDGPPLASTLVDRLDSLVSGLLVPIFVSVCAMKTNLSALTYTCGTQTDQSVDAIPEYNLKSVWIIAFIIVVAFLGKITASALPSLSLKLPLKEALSLALIVSAKGVVEMGTYNMYLAIEAIDEQVFAMAILSVLLAAGIMPNLVRALYSPSRKYAGYEKKTILHSKNDSELRLLVCVHEHEDIHAIMKLLEASNPTTESPICTYVLHLIELVGRASPLFITHQMGQTTNDNTSRSKLIIDSFNIYEQRSRGTIKGQAFTATSPHSLMHNDICTLALDKMTSLIILPFHKKWATNGTVVSEDHTMRALNCNVLNCAPCSVGILVNRGHFGASVSMLSKQSSYCVGMVFMGGADDREALAFAKRMSKDSSTNLVVVRLIAAEKLCNNDGWEEMLDAEAVRDIKRQNVGNEGIVYREEEVTDGVQTAYVIRSMANEHDLIIVGRSHGKHAAFLSGLTEWSEYPELGVIGDMLSSSDIDSRVSVLVVQQQQSQQQQEAR